MREEKKCLLCDKSFYKLKSYNPYVWERKIYCDVVCSQIVSSIRIAMREGKLQRAIQICQEK